MVELSKYALVQYTNKVLFCGAGPVTEVYIKDMWPDAMNLYVFYTDEKKYYDVSLMLVRVSMLSQSSKVILESL